MRHGGVLIARYGYDVVGRRIVKRVYSGATGGTVGYLRMVYAGSQVSFETDSANTSLSTIYTWGPGVDNLVAVRVAGTTYAAVTDGLGSVRAFIRQADGAWVGRLTYDPYGQLLDSAGTLPAGRYRWTGREYDAETGLYFHRSRFYDPAAGRFVQEDPLGYAGADNPYAYVAGDVLQSRDPMGAFSLPPAQEGCEWWVNVRRRYSDDAIVWIGSFFLKCTGSGAHGKLANFEKLHVPMQQGSQSLAKELCEQFTAQQGSAAKAMYNFADMNGSEYGQVFDVSESDWWSWTFTPRTPISQGLVDMWPPGNEVYRGEVFFVHAHVPWRSSASGEMSEGDKDLAHNNYWGANHAGQWTWGMGLARRTDLLVEAYDRSSARCRY